MGHILFLILCSLLVPTHIASAEVKSLILEDFEPSSTALSLKYEEGAWNGNVTGWLVPETRNLNQTTVLKLTYNSSGKDSPYGYYFKFNSLDITDFINFNFFIKGDRFEGFPKSIDIELSDGKATARCKVTGITSLWKRITFPLKDFKIKLDCSKINQLKIVFNGSAGEKGSIYIDDIYLSGSLSARAVTDQQIIQGNEYTDNKFYTFAVEEYQKVLEKEPDNIYAHTNLGVTYVKQQRYFDAEHEFKKAIQINPMYAPAHLRLAVLYDEFFFDTKRAIKHYRKFLELDTSGDYIRREEIKRWIELNQ